MNARPSIRRRAERGIALLSALLAIAVLFLAVVAILRFTSSSANNAGSVQLKQTAMDAAEAGLNDGIRALDVASGNMTPGNPGSSGTNTLSTGATYTWTLAVNNVGGSGPTPAPDGVSVPNGMYYITSTASVSSQRAQTVGAIIAKATGASGPDVAIAAGQNIYDQKINVSQSANNQSADVHANGIITVGGNPGLVQGSTYAAGSTNAWTKADHAYTGATPVTFPSSGMVTALTEAALGLAKSGTTIQGSNPTGTYTGNVYVNGSINLSSGTITFNGGGTVYVNGNVVISGQGVINNNNGSLIVVSGTFDDSGNGGMHVNPGGQLMVLAADPNPTLCASGGGSGCAATVSGNGYSIGMLFVPNGSVAMTGNGTLIGALAAGDNVILGGGGHGTFQYDPVSAAQHITASNYKVVSYIED